ncbi:MAG: tetratricopeptide repeat protein [Ignavibacteriaceae bacterium]
MQKSKLILASAILVGLMFTGFSCSSSNLTGARLYIQQKNYDAAYAALQKELSTNPKSDEGWYLLGYVYGEKGQMDSMVVSFDKSLAISNQFKKDITDYRKFFWANEYNKGVGYFQKGNNAASADSIKLYYDKSIEAFNTATMLEPDSSTTYKNLAFVYINAGRYNDAINPLQKLIDKDKSRDGYRYLGQIYYDQGRKYKSMYESSKNVQDSLSYMDYYNKAIKVLEDGRKLYPNDSDFLVILSNSYIGAHKTEVAMDAFKAGIEQDPGNKYYHYNYGVLLLGAKDFQKSIDQFKKALEIDSKYVNAEYNLGVAYLKWGDYLNEEADKQGVKSEAYKEKIEVAIPYLENAVQLDATQADMWETLGKAYSIMGNQTGAKSAFDKADHLRK